MIGVEDEGGSEGEQMEAEEEVVAVAVVAVAVVAEVGRGKWRGGGRADDGKRTRRVALV